MFSQALKAEELNYKQSGYINKNNSISSLNSQEINLNLNQEKKQAIELNTPAKEISDELFTSKEDTLKNYLEVQKKLDVEDIKILWESTVKRNPVIKFALRKLSLPADQQRINSSVFAKTVTTLISGASMLPAIFGADAIISSATSTTGSLANRFIANKKLPKEMPLTDTEIIHLARLVEDLQDKIIKNYYQYKGNLESYKIAKENIVKHNRIYTQALESRNTTRILTSKALYDKSLITERNLKQEIKLNRLLLERLAGAETVNALNLGKATLIGDLEESKTNPETQTAVKPPIPNESVVEAGKLDYCETDIRELAEEISSEIDEEKEEVLADLQILWGATVEKSETLRFAILKLSNPEGEVEKTGVVKKILSPVASIAPIIGLGLSDPVTATGAMFGGGLLSSILSDDSKLNAHFTKVTDADLVLLAQETDSLQEKLVVLYYEYLNSIMNLKANDKTVKQNSEYLKVMQGLTFDLSCLANVFYEETLDSQYKNRQNVLNKRVALEQFVGNEALVAIDKNINNRI